MTKLCIKAWRSQIKLSGKANIFPSLTHWRSVLITLKIRIGKIFTFLFIIFLVITVTYQNHVVCPVMLCTAIPVHFQRPLTVSVTVTLDKNVKEFPPFPARWQIFRHSCRDELFRPGLDGKDAPFLTNFRTQHLGRRKC